MAHPGAQRGSSPEEKGLLGGEEGTPPAEVAWSQSSRATTSRGRGVLPVDSRKPLQMPEQQNNLQMRAEKTWMQCEIEQNALLSP